MRGILNSKAVLGAIVIVSVLLPIMSSCSDINTVNDPHFESDGTFIKDSTESVFIPEVPLKAKFFVEVSGSMNGFFRPNLPTQFKADVWQILSYYSKITPEVTILTNNGDMGANIPLADFQTKMNTGAFISAASTKVPLMLQSIIANLKPETGEVAVLISDMKYSPVGSAAPNVLLSQYSTDVSKILGNYGKAVSLIGATSEYLDKSGNMMTDKSPYYFFIIGEGKHVASVRNVISSMLQMNEHLIDNFDSGFDFGTVSCSFGIPENCYQLNEEPTFIGFEGDTCTVKMKVDLENYRWIMTNPEVFEKAFQVKPIYGSNVKVGNIEFDVKNITEKEHTNLLIRKATAIVDLKVYDLAQDSEVIEWNIDLPDTEASVFAPYILGAQGENDVTKSYSVDNFMKGMFQGSVVNKSLKPSYILISKKS